jgi:hypothetical protein
MFLAMAKDIRVVIIKLADRLHNMRTLEYVPTAKQGRIARETMEIYCPIANRLGIGEIKGELEDLCFKYLDPEHYAETKKIEETYLHQGKAYMDETVMLFRTLLEKEKIKVVDISGSEPTEKQSPRSIPHDRKIIDDKNDNGYRACRNNRARRPNEWRRTGSERTTISNILEWGERFSEWVFGSKRFRSRKLSRETAWGRSIGKSAIGRCAADSKRWNTGTKQPYTVGRSTAAKYTDADSIRFRGLIVPARATAR